ncbi:hypothetical protein UlMin_029359, partial [Ulmus minor]
MEEEGHKIEMENKETESLVEAANKPLKTPSEVLIKPTETPAEAIKKPTETPAEAIKKPTEIPAEETQEPAEIPTGTSTIPSNKLETSNKKTPKSLRAKNRMLKKALVVNPAKAPKKKANPQVRGMKKKKKNIESRNNEGEGAEERKARKDKGPVDIVNEDHNEKSDQLEKDEEKSIESEKSQQKLNKGKQHVGSANEEHTENNHQTEKNKEKNSESEMNQQKLKKGEKHRRRGRGLKTQKSNEKPGETDKGPSSDKKEKLGGLIFMCSGKTKPDCFNYQVMGVSMGKKDIVLGIRPGLKLFLYDFDLKLLYGIYAASSSGGVKLEPKAFGGAFPAQVRFNVAKDCLPLPETVFRKAIEENYNEKNKFKTELTKPQVSKLTALFRPAEISISRPVRSPQPTIPRDRGIREGPRESQSLSARKRESHSHRKKRARESDANGDSRSYRRRSRERDQNVGYREGRREEAPRNLYLTEKEYRTYGLRGERRDRTPPPPVAAPVVETYRRDYEREQLLRHPNVVLRDTIPAYRETIHPEPLYLNDREYQPYNLQARRELPAIPP